MARISRFSRKPRFRRNRRRGSGGTWFPILGSDWVDEGQPYTDASITDEYAPVPLSKSTGPQLGVYPVTSDYSLFTTQGLDHSLRDIVEGQDFLLKRLVGNIFVFTKNGVQPTAPYTPAYVWPHVQVSAGFFVARASDDAQAFPDLTQDEYDPQNRRNIQNSWIWRRTWILDNPQNNFLLTGAGETTIDFSWDFSSNRDFDAANGPFFDSKVKRRIKREERLWFVLGAQGWDGGRVSVIGEEDQQPHVAINLDVRLFGAMRRGRASPTF